jgi:hypothetical protein
MPSVIQTYSRLCPKGSLIAAAAANPIMPSKDRTCTSVSCVMIRLAFATILAGGAGRPDHGVDGALSSAVIIAESVDDSFNVYEEQGFEVEPKSERSRLCECQKHAHDFAWQPLIAVAISL